MLGAALGVLGIGATKALTEYTKNKKKATNTNTATKTTTSKNTYDYKNNIPTSVYNPVGTYNDHDIKEYNPTDYAAIQKAKDDYTKAFQSNNTDAMNAAHATAETIRSRYNYSGGGDGSEYIGGKQPAAPVSQNTSKVDLPEMNLPDYEKFKYDDFNYGKEFSYDDFNYKDFNYDANSDPSYKQYADMYARQGQSASEKALANTAAATGGMTSSYAAAANAQAQQAYAKKTADMIPVLEEQAYGRHTDERNFSYQDYLNDRSLEYDKHYNDKNFSYQDYINNRNLALGEHQNKYGFDRDNALSEYNADWQNINYSDSRNDLEYDRKYQQEQFDYQKYLNDLDENYRQDTFDWNKTTDERDYNRGVYADDRNYNYNSGQDAIRNSISWANQGLSKDKFEYDKTQDELARQDREEQAKREKYQQGLDVNYPNTVMGQLEERTRQAQEEEKANSIRAAVSSAMQAPNAADWLRENASVMNDEEYASVMKILKDYGALKKQGE